MKELAESFPERFNNKTNGVTPRRWLLLCNPELSGLITNAIGDGWIRDLSQLSKLKDLSLDSAFRHDFLKAKRNAKRGLFVIGSGGRQDSSLILTRSLIAKSNGSTSTSVSC